MMVLHIGRVDHFFQLTTGSKNIIPLGLFKEVLKNGVRSVFSNKPALVRQAFAQPIPQVGLTKLEAKIIAEIKKDNKISRRQIASNLRIKPDTVKEYLNKLKDKRVLRRIGKTSGGYWFVNYKDV